MNPTRIFLGLSVLLWLPYGVYCFFQPHALGDSAGVTALRTKINVSSSLTASLISSASTASTVPMAS